MEEMKPKKIAIHKVTTRTPESAVKWLENHFETKTEGAEFVLQAFPDLYARTLHELRGIFSRGELCALLDVFNGVWLTAEIGGQHLLLEIHDAIQLNGLDAKWKIDGPDFLERLKELPFAAKVALELWATGFWKSGAWEDQANGVENWSMPLIAKED